MSHSLRQQPSPTTSPLQSTSPTTSPPTSTLNLQDQSANPASILRKTHPATSLAAVRSRPDMFAANTVWRMLSQRNILGGDGADASSSSASESSSSSSYHPTFCDVLVVKTMLLRAGHLPLELVDVIVDHAAYWAHTCVEIDYPREIGHDLNVSSHPMGNEFLLRTPPLGFQRAPVLGDEDDRHEYMTDEPEPRPAPGDVSGGGSGGGSGDESVLCSVDDIRGWLPSGHAPLLEHPCRRIVFTIVSHDQGWASRGDRGGYGGSYTWFDVGLERYGWAKAPKELGAAPPQPPQNEAAPFAPAAPRTASLYTLRPDVVDAVPPPANNHFDHPRRAQPTNQPQRPYQFSFPLLPGVDCLQMNRCATRNFTEHTVVWSWNDETPREEDLPPAVTNDPENGAPDLANNGNNDNNNTEPQETEALSPLQKIGRGADTGDGAFVRNLRVGDVVTVWAKARFPGWTNTVKRVRVDVYWAV